MELFLLGRNFDRNTKVVFREYTDGRRQQQNLPYTECLHIENCRRRHVLVGRGDNRQGSFSSG